MKNSMQHIEDAIKEKDEILLKMAEKRNKIKEKCSGFQEDIKKMRNRHTKSLDEFGDLNFDE